MNAPRGASKLTRVFLVFDSVRPRQKGLTRAEWLAGTRVRARWVARGTSGDLYYSKPCGTEDEARALAMKWLARNADAVVDTSTHRVRTS